MHRTGHRVFLIRHGEPAEDVGTDPGLTVRGHEQASALPHLLPPLALRTSPLQRARETAAPLEAAWGRVAVIDPTFRELPSGHADSASRRAWLRGALAGTFADLGAEQRDWRDAIVAGMRAFRTDTAVTTHAVVINVATGHCLADDAVLRWVPGHASVTEFHVDGAGVLTLVARGEGRLGGVVV